MLSRVADSLFWLSRFIERAENLARLVAVNRHDSLDARADGDGDDSSARWRPVLYATSSEDVYRKVAAEGGEDDKDVGFFITFARSNPDSICSCIAKARENARMVRDQIAEEMWLELNGIHLFLQSREAEVSFRYDPERFYQRIIRFSLIFQGLTDATILHHEGWRFFNLGKFLERADKTSRILDTLTFGDLQPERPALTSVLRSCSGVSAFREEFRGEVTLGNVAAFLLFSQEFPRSVRFCLRRLDATLHALSGMPTGGFANEGERLTGSTLARINFCSMDEVWRTGLHEFIDSLQGQFNAIGQEIFETYVLLPSEIQNVTPTDGLQMTWQHHQQQQQQ